MSANSSSTVALAYKGHNYSPKIVAKKSKTSQRTSPKGSEPPPPRITSNVKQNLRILRSLKKKSNTTRPTTSYRRKKIEKDEMPEGPELYRDPTLASDYTNQDIEIRDPVLLVDGYNICGYWEKLKEHFMNGRLDIARQMLIDDLVTFSAIAEMKVVVVFDAAMSGIPTHRENFAGVDIVYSGETSADTWIANEVVALMKDGYSEVRVATSDYCEQLEVYAAGGFVWSSKMLVAEIKDAQKEEEEIMREQRLISMQRSVLKHCLDPTVVAALKDLRDQLSKNRPPK